MTYSVIVQCLALELGVFVADDDESALRYAKQNYDHHNNEAYYVRNCETNKLVDFI